MSPEVDRAVSDAALPIRVIRRPVARKRGGEATVGPVIEGRSMSSGTNRGWRHRSFEASTFRAEVPREDAEAAIKEALAAAARERSMKSVYVRFPGGEAGLRSLAEAEFQRCFADKGYAVMAVSVEARVLVSGEVRTEDMGQAQALGVDVGRSCRASLRVEALFGVGEAGQKKISGFKDAAGIGRTPAQACEIAVKNAAGPAADDIVERVSRAIEE